MKWSSIFFGSACLFLFSLPTLLISKLVWGNAVPNVLAFIPLAAISLLIIAFKPLKNENSRSIRHAVYDFLEFDAILKKADLCDYPPEYVRDIEETAAELSKAGMIFEADCYLPAEELSISTGKVFGRILRTRDGAVWAVVKRLRPNLLFRIIVTLTGMRVNLKNLTEFSVFFDDGSVMGLINGKLPLALQVPGVPLDCYPVMPPTVLFRKCLEQKAIRENNNRSLKALSLDFASFSRHYLSNELYVSFMNQKQPFPAETVLQKEGFSPRAIEKYRNICLRPVSVSLPEPEAPLAMNVSSVPTPTEIPAEFVPLRSSVEASAKTSLEWDAALKDYAGAVTNLGVAVLLSTVNVILISTDADISFPFSAFFPTFATILGKTAVEEGQPEILATIFLAIAIASVAVYALCWLLSRKYRCFILISFLLFIFDTILLIPFIPEGGGSIWVDVVFHAWMLWTLFVGVKAWRNLKRQQPLMPKTTPGRDGKAAKGCLIGCASLVGIVVILLAALLGIGIAAIPPPVKFADMPLSVEENSELTKAFIRLDKALTAKAPVLQAKRKPLEAARRIQLDNATQTKKLEALYMWYEFVSGLEGCELIPGAEIVGVEFAANLREMSDTPLLRMTAPDRTRAMMLLHDGAGDGYFLGMTPELTGVFYEMLETPGEDGTIGSLAHFVNLIANAIEQDMWNYDKDGKIVVTDEAAEEFMSKILGNAPKQPEKNSNGVAK